MMLKSQNFQVQCIFIRSKSKIFLDIRFSIYPSICLKTAPFNESNTNTTEAEKAPILYLRKLIMSVDEKFDFAI